MIKNRGVDNYEQPGWTLITQDNEDEIYRLESEGKVIFIKSVVEYSDHEPEVFTGCKSDFTPSISTMAKYGGYYYHAVDVPPFTTDL